MGASSSAKPKATRPLTIRKPTGKVLKPKNDTTRGRVYDQREAIDQQETKAQRHKTGYKGNVRT